MGFLDNVLMALASIKSNKMRSFLTMLGIIIGISSVITIMTIGDSLQGAVSGDMADFGAADIQVNISKKEDENKEDDGFFGMFGSYVDPNELKQEDLITNEMIDEYKSVFKDDLATIVLSENCGNDEIHMNGGKAKISITAGSPDVKITNQVEMVTGRFIDDNDVNHTNKVAVVSDYFVKKVLNNDLEHAIGQTVYLNVNGYTREVQIVGIYHYKESSGPFAEEDPTTMLYIPISTGMRMLGKVGGYSSFVVRGKPLVDVEEFTTQTQNFFKTYYTHNAKYTVKASNMTSMLDSFKSIMDKITMAISGIAAISLLVGGIGVMNIMLVSITERTKEIGTRKALGATSNNIRLQFITESVILCLVGGAIGILLGTINGMAAAKLLNFAARPSMKAIGISVGFSMAIGVFFGFYPANKAAKMNPIDALRYE